MAGSAPDERYRGALLDWLACAVRGSAEPAARAAARAADGVTGRVAAAGAAGHVLDFDDTYLPGLAHLSAPAAPAALVVAAERGAALGDALAGYAAGFEAMGAIARASHPALYRRGWHPTAVCGAAGAAVAAARVIGLDRERERTAVALALLRAGGLRSAFGSDGKALQVGAAAAAGVRAALLAEAGASADLDRVAGAPAGFEQAFGARFAEPDPARPAIAENWIKAYPCCLQTHAAIEAALAGREEAHAAARIEVRVHPVSLDAAPVGDPATGLEAKFSIPYLTAFALLRGAPEVASFAAPDAEARALAAARVTVAADAALRESEAVLLADGVEAARVGAALGSPERPLDDGALAAKVRGLAGDRLGGLLDDAAAPAGGVLSAAGL